MRTRESRAAPAKDPGGELAPALERREVGGLLYESADDGVLDRVTVRVLAGGKLDNELVARVGQGVDQAAARLCSENED